MLKTWGTQRMLHILITLPLFVCIIFGYPASSFSQGVKDDKASVKEEEKATISVDIVDALTVENYGLRIEILNRDIANLRRMQDEYVRMVAKRLDVKPEDYGYDFEKRSFVRRKAQ